MSEVKRTERGWVGHFICASQCRFRRNTLLEYKDQKIVVSTVGNMINAEGLPDTVGTDGRRYETRVFEAHVEGAYLDANVSREVDYNGVWEIRAINYEDLPKDVDTAANNMHEHVVGIVREEMLDKSIVFINE